MVIDELQLQIKHFWEWFSQNEYRFRRSTDKKAAVEALNNQVLAFGFFSWEIGQGQRKPYYFAISPNGNKQRLQLSKAIMDAAPSLSHWEFHYCKPPKDWDFSFEMYDAFMIKQRFKADNWQYVLLQKKNGRFKILLKAENIQTLDRDDQQAAGKLAVNNILGEQLVIEKIDAIEMVHQFALKYVDYCCELPELGDHFDEVLA